MNIDDVYVKVVENSVQLGMMLAQMAEFKRIQEANHVVALALKEHETIPHTDELWKKNVQSEARQSLVRWLLRGLAGALVTVPGSLLLSHLLINWSK